MTQISLRDNDIAPCDIRELDVWAAMDAYRAAFAAASADELAGDGDMVYHLRQAALETVIAERMRVFAVISIHRALLAGASIAEIAHLLGSSPGEVAERWRGWADAQRELNRQFPGAGLGRRDHERVAAVLAAGRLRDGLEGEGTGRCSCGSGDTQIGSPHP